MDIVLKHEEYKILEAITDNSVEECIEADFSLPEFMPEILRIVKSTAQPKVNSCRLSGERVTVDGECELRMVYTAEDGGIYSFSQSRPFTRHCESVNFSEAADVNCRINVGFVNCRATSTKRAEIKAGLVIKITAYKEKAEDIISIDNNPCVQEKTVSISAASLGCKKSRRFSMSDTIALNSPSAFIIGSSAAAVCNDIKKISNKIMLKGEAMVEICYVCAADKTRTERIRHTLPINQILEFDGMEERFFGNVALNVCSLDIMQKNEQDGVGNAFDIALGIDAEAAMWETKELTVINDAYAVGTGVDLIRKPYAFYKSIGEICDIHIHKSDFQISGEGVSRILDCSCEITSVQVKKEKNGIVVFGTLSMALIVQDNCGSLVNANKVIDYRYENNIDLAEKDFVFTPDVTVLSSNCVEKGNGAVDACVEMRVSGCVFEKVVVDTVTDITESKVQAVRKTNAITVYFPQGEESLWSIARRYNTTVEAIASENEIDGETTENLKMIFIPAV